MSEEEIEKAKADAEANAEADKNAKDAAEARNLLDNAIFGIEKVLTESGDKFEADDKTYIEEQLKEAKEALESGDAERIKAATEKLNKDERIQQAMVKFYQEQAGAEGAGGPMPEGVDPTAGAAPQGEPAKAGPNVVDAEVEDVTDEKK